jgi:hypothetical protein
VALGRGAAESDRRVRRHVAARAHVLAVTAATLYPATPTGSLQR